MLVLLAPWTVATILAWVYTEAFEEPPEDSSKLGWIGAILQTVSLVVYLVYIPVMVLFVGIAGRRSLFSFCCLVMGIPVFAVAPLVAGGVILSTALVAEDTRVKEVGIAAAVCCVLSTVTCFLLLCWAIACGGKGRGKHHRYPIPLAYFPFLRDFEEVEREKQEDDSDRYTADYPPPYVDRKLSVGSSMSASSRAAERRPSSSALPSSRIGERRMSTSSVPPRECRTSAGSLPQRKRRASTNSVPILYTRERRVSTSSAQSMDLKLSDNSSRAGKQRRTSTTSSTPTQERERKRSTSSASSVESTPLPLSSSSRVRRQSLGTFQPIPEHCSTRRVE